KMGPDGLGLLLSAPAVGAVAGSLVMSVAPIPRRPGLGIIAAILAYGLCIIGFGVSTTIWLSLVLLAGSGAADAVSMAMRHAIRTRVAPAWSGGRGAAALSTVSRGGPQLGEVRAGATASIWGPQAAIAIGAIASVIGCIVMARLDP